MQTSCVEYWKRTGKTQRHSSSSRVIFVIGGYSAISLSHSQSTNGRDRGTRFNCTPYYHNAPPPPNPVPPVPQETLPASFPPPDLVKHFAKASPEVPIWKSIQFMDHEGMDLLRRPAEFGALEKWEAYLARTNVSLTITHRANTRLTQSRTRFVAGIQSLFWSISSSMFTAKRVVINPRLCL